MDTHFANTYAMHMPLTEALLKENILLSEEATLLTKHFLSLSRELNPVALEAALTQLLTTYRESQTQTSVIASNLSISKLQQEHEHYFKIIRHQNQTGSKLIESTLEAYRAFLADYQFGSSLTLIDLEHINSGLRSLLSYLLYSSENQHV